jgi:hypothetical protein
MGDSRSLQIVSFDTRHVHGERRAARCGGARSSHQSPYGAWVMVAGLAGNAATPLVAAPVILIAADSQSAAQPPSLAGVARDQVVLNGAG